MIKPMGGWKGGGCSFTFIISIIGLRCDLRLLCMDLYKNVRLRVERETIGWDRGNIAQKGEGDL